MEKFKSKFNKTLPIIIEKLGYLINPFLLNFQNENDQLIVFYFHGIYRNSEQKRLNHVDPQNNITISEFDSFINYFLGHGYTFIKPEDLLTGLQQNRRYAMITFDDGYFSNSLAIDVLNKYKVPGVIFISTRNVLENKSFWWDIVYKYRKKQGIGLEAIKREQAYLKGFKYSYIEHYIEENFGLGAISPWSDIDRPFNVNELKDISKNSLINIGNHTHNHSILTNYNREEIRQELEVANKVLMELTGNKPMSVAFPNGNFNTSVLGITEEVGFHFAFTTEQRKNPIPIQSNGFACINRLMVKDENINRYGSFYRMGYSPISVYSNFKNRLLPKNAAGKTNWIEVQKENI